MLMYGIKLQNGGKTEWGGEKLVWLTEEQYDVVIQNQYDDNLRDKPLKYGGRWFRPSDFVEVSETRELKDLAESSQSADSALIKSLFDEGYAQEAIEAFGGGGFGSYVDKLIAERKEKGLPIGENDTKTPNVNLEGLKRLKMLKENHAKKGDA